MKIILHSQVFFHPHFLNLNLIALRTMQDNWYFCYPESAPFNSAASIDIPSTFTDTSKSADLQEWSPVASPVIENSDGSVTTPSGVSENVDYVAHASCFPRPLNRMLPVTPTGGEYTVDAHSRLWPSAAEAGTAHAYAPQAAWRDETSLGLRQRHRSQDPSGPTDLDTFGQSWSQRGDDRHAVPRAPAVPEPAFLRSAYYPRHPVPAWSYIPALPERAISTSHAGLGNLSPWVADPVLRQALSPSKRRRHYRRPPQQPVTCDKCMKSMRRQSLRRHIREVHDHIKRPHAKPRFVAQSGP
ncbi:hypothetical protein OG21DRAFT_972206 [Imleria badia]|nr:hypothetical protein OG21DRAFT_972206 [Imleria badia]